QSAASARLPDYLRRSHRRYPARREPVRRPGMKLPTHTTFRAPRYRAAFTLIELMVVIAIIGIVVTLAASGTMQVIARQKSANTEKTIRKVNDALKAHWSSLFQQAHSEQIPANILFA